MEIGKFLEIIEGTNGDCVYSIHEMSKKQSNKTGGYKYLAMPNDPSNKTPFAFDYVTDEDNNACVHTQDLSYAEAMHL